MLSQVFSASSPDNAATPATSFSDAPVVDSAKGEVNIDAGIDCDMTISADTAQAELASGLDSSSPDKPILVDKPVVVGELVVEEPVIVEPPVIV